MNTTHAMRTGRRGLQGLCGALCAAGLLAAAPALAAEMSDVETAPGAGASTEPVTAMADPAAAMPAQEAAAPDAAKAETQAMPAQPAQTPAMTAAVAAALNDYYHGDYMGAADRLNAAAALNPADPAAPYFLGYTYYRMGEFAKSRAAFARAYKVDPHFSPEPPASK
jgi:Flp pilus assembly protein TadD